MKLPGFAGVTIESAEVTMRHYRRFRSRSETTSPLFARTGFSSVLCMRVIRAVWVTGREARAWAGAGAWDGREVPKWFPGGLHRFECHDKAGLRHHRRVSGRDQRNV